MTDERRPADRVISALLGDDWLITEAGRAQLIEIASRENVITADVLRRIDERKEAVAARKAVRLDGSNGALKRDGIALIDVRGPIFRYADLFSQVSGGSSVEALAEDFNTAMDDRLTNGVLFTFDSYGGQAKGIHEFANMIAERRGEKPIGGYIGSCAGSAAYWIAAAVTPGLLWIDAIGEAGSVGARLGVRAAPAAGGTREFTSKVSPYKALDPNTEAGEAEYQGKADYLGDVFVESVARLRGVARAKVLKDFGQGRMLMGQQAVSVGLADRLGSLEELMRKMREMHREGRVAVEASAQPINITALTLGADWRLS